MRAGVEEELLRGVVGGELPEVDEGGALHRGEGAAPEAAEALLPAAGRRGRAGSGGGS